MRMIPFHDTGGMLLGWFDAGNGQRTASEDYDVIRFDSGPDRSDTVVDDPPKYVELYDFHQTEATVRSDRGESCAVRIWIAWDELLHWMDKYVVHFDREAHMRMPPRHLRAGVIR